MKALIGRDTDGWSTRGFVARLETGQILTAPSAGEMVQKLRAAGIDEIELPGSHDGDRTLSAALRQSLLDAWNAAA